MLGGDYCGRGRRVGALTWYHIRKAVPMLSPDKKTFRIDRRLLKTTLRYGSVTALQQACQPVGKLLIQGAVNPLGVDVIAAFQAVNRVDDFAFTPEQSISHGITTFTAQNLGSRQDEERKRERVAAGLRTGLLLEFLYWISSCGGYLSDSPCSRHLRRDNCLCRGLDGDAAF